MPTLWAEEAADTIVRLITTDLEGALVILVKTGRVAFRPPSQRTKLPKIRLMSHRGQATKRLQEAHCQWVAEAVEAVVGMVVVHQ